MKSTTSLSITGLSAGYPKREVIRDLTLPALASGSLTAVIGPNGAGKTTLLRALGGLLPARGEALHGGRNLLALKPAELARHVTYMPQALPAGVALTVIESVVTALRAVPRAEDGTDADIQSRAEAILDRLGIGALALAGLGELSGGQRQLVSLAQTLVRRPKILLLDEPTSALDPRHQLTLMGAVREHIAGAEAIGVIVLHDLNLALRWADTVILLKDGALHAAGRPEEAVTPETLASAYGVAARVERCSRDRPHVQFDGIGAD